MKAFVFAILLSLLCCPAVPPLLGQEYSIELNGTDPYRFDGPIELGGAGAISWPDQLLHLAPGPGSSLDVWHDGEPPMPQWISLFAEGRGTANTSGMKIFGSSGEGWAGVYTFYSGNPTTKYAFRTGFQENLWEFSTGPSYSFAPLVADTADLGTPARRLRRVYSQMANVKHVGALPTCDAAEEGTLAYDADHKNWCGCNGTAWAPFGGAGTCD